MIILILILSLTKIYSLESYELYNGIRPLGMGNTGLAFLDDENVNFYNPAGISIRSYNSKPQIDLINPSFAFNTNIIDSFSDILSGLSSISDFIKTKTGKNYHTNFSLFPNISIRNMSIGVLMQANVDARNTGTFYQDNPANPYFSLTNTYDIIPTFSIGLPLYGSILKLGSSAKIIWRAQFDETLPYSQMVDMTFKDQLREGFALAVDAGAILTLPVMYLPSFTLVARNIGNTKFYDIKNIMSTNPPGVPDTLLQTLDLGFACFVIISSEIKLKYGLDYRDILNEYENHWSKHLHTGAELAYGKGKNPFLKFRTGLNQLRATFGFSLSSKNNTLDFAFYGSELGNTLLEKSDYRYLVRYVVSLY